MERAANSNIWQANVLVTRKATLYDRNCKLTCRRGSKGPQVRALRTRDRSQVGYRCRAGEPRLVTPRRNCLIRKSLEKEPVEPQDRIEERAATCLLRVLGAKPALRPSCKEDCGSCAGPWKLSSRWSYRCGWLRRGMKRLLPLSRHRSSARRLVGATEHPGGPTNSG